MKRSADEYKKNAGKWREVEKSAEEMKKTLKKK